MFANYRISYLCRIWNLQLRKLQSFIDGKIIGDENALITGVSPIENGESGHLSFIAQDRFSHFWIAQNALLSSFRKNFWRKIIITLP